MQLLRDAWAGLDAKGRTVLVICVALIIIAVVVGGGDMSAVWALLGYNVDSVLAWLGAN